MNRDYTNYSGHASQSPEPREHHPGSGCVSPNTRPVPSMQRNYGNAYASGNYGVANGSLRSTRTSVNSGQAYGRSDQPIPRPPQGSLRRAHLGAFEDNAYAAQHLQPYVPDASERRTPDLYAQNDACRRSGQLEGARATPPPPLPPIVTSYPETDYYSSRPVNVRKYRMDEQEDRPVASQVDQLQQQQRFARRGSTASNQSAGYEPRGLRESLSPGSTGALGSARLIPGDASRKSPAPQRLYPSQRVEFGYSSPVRAILAQSPERDEIADIIADMSKTRMGSGEDNEDGDKRAGSVYLQLGDDTKRAKLVEKQPSMTTLMNLFIEKYQGRLAEDPEALPSIYVKDAKTGIFYELEDTRDVVDGSVLSWRTQPLVNATCSVGSPLQAADRSADIAPAEASEKELRTQQELDSLASIVKALSETVSQLPGQLRDEIRAASADYKKHTDEVLSAAVKAQSAGNRTSAAFVSPAPAIAMDFDDTEANRPGLLRSASLPAVHMAEMDELRDKLRRAEQTLAIERQAHREAETRASEDKETMAVELAKLKSDVSRHPNLLRVRIEEGKAMLKSEYRLLNVRFEDLDAMIQGMRKDVAQRGSIPSTLIMKNANAERKGIESGTRKLIKFINETRSDWKRTWEEELQNILKEQSFVKDVEQMLGELADDNNILGDVLNKLDKIIDLKLEERAKGDYASNAVAKFIDVVSADEAVDAKKDFLMQISCVDVDHARRLEALEAAEKLRQQELAFKVNEFDEELSEFVTLLKLRKTGGTEELERRRAEKDVEVMKEMLKSVEEAEQARRAKLAQRKQGKK
ncbi:Bud site selection protein 6 [Kickxella alabastrina]|uniref:Bud site selection protein 6 n=1 Tax=Kickxella alabastrina TaxID=61397 RepID=A0ACC1IT79_9FUNG|nr:Bud site selection protein 6 [Kickxella alabastrina]